MSGNWQTSTTMRQHALLTCYWTYGELCPPKIFDYKICNPKSSKRILALHTQLANLANLANRAGEGHRHHGRDTSRTNEYCNAYSPRTNSKYSLNWVILDY